MKEKINNWDKVRNILIPLKKQMPLSTIEIPNKIFSNMNIFELELANEIHEYRNMQIYLPLATFL